MVLTRRGIVSTSVLCIVGVITLPILGNLISNDLYNILQSWLSLGMRLLIVSVMIILCVFALIMEDIYHKDRRLFVRLFKNTRLLLPLFKVFKGRSYLKVLEPPDSRITICTSSGFKRAYDPLRNDPDALIVRNMLNSCREEGSRIQSLVRIHMALKVHNEQQVPDVEAALRSEYTTKSSRVLHRRFEIGPQTGNVDLDVLSLQIAEAMRLAREIDENCTLQFGSFAFLKYTDGELKWWRLHEHWTPVIRDIRRSPWNILTGDRSMWVIRGSNLQEATLKASTSDEKEEMTIVHRRKMENGEDELLCAEPGLMWRSALTFWRGVYICASNSVSKENEALTFDLQSESRNVTRAYWFSVAKGFIPDQRTIILILAFVWGTLGIANLVVLKTLGCGTHGTRSGMSSQLGSCYLGHLKITIQVLFIFLEFVILALWWFTAKLSPPSGCPLPQQSGSPDPQDGRNVRAVSSLLFKKENKNDPNLLNLVDCVDGEIEKARDEVRAQEEGALTRCSGPVVRCVTPSVIACSSERLAHPSRHDLSVLACTEDPVSDLEAAELHPLKKTDTNVVRKEEEEDKSASGVAETTDVADLDHSINVSATPSAMIEFQSNGKRESISEPETEETENVTIVKEEGWLAEYKQDEGLFQERMDVKIEEQEEEEENEISLMQTAKSSPGNSPARKSIVLDSKSTVRRQDLPMSVRALRSLSSDGSSKTRTVAIAIEAHKKYQIDPFIYAVNNLEEQKVVVIICLSRLQDEMGVDHRIDVNSMTAVSMKKLEAAVKTQITSVNNFLRSFRYKLNQRGVPLEITVSTGPKSLDILIQAAKALHPHWLVLDRSFSSEKKKIQAALECNLVLMKKKGIPPEILQAVIPANNIHEEEEPELISCSMSPSSSSKTDPIITRLEQLLHAFA